MMMVMMMTVSMAMTTMLTVTIKVTTKLNENDNEYDAHDTSTWTKNIHSLYSVSFPHAPSCIYDTDIAYIFNEI